MSQLLQGKVEFFTDSNEEPPALYWNGIPMEADGALSVDSVGARVQFGPGGLPLTALGRIAITETFAEFFNSGAMPLTFAQRLAITQSKEPVSTLAANGYAVDGALKFGKL